MGNAVVCGLDREVRNEYTNRRESGQEAKLTERRRHPEAAAPHLRPSTKMRPDTVTVDAYGKIGCSVEQQLNLRSSTGVSHAMLCGLSGSTPAIAEFGRASATPPLEPWQSLLPHTDSFLHVDPQHDYVIDLETWPSHAWPDSIAAAPRDDESAEPSGHSSCLSLSSNEFDLPADFYVAECLEYVVATEQQAPLSDPPTPVPPPRPSVRPVESPVWDALMLPRLLPTPLLTASKPAAEPAFTAVSSTAPVAPSPYPFLPGGTGTGAAEPKAGQCNPDGDSAASGSETKTPWEPMHAPPSPLAQPEQHRPALGEVQALGSGHEAKSAHRVTSSARQKESKGCLPKASAPRRMTDMGATAVLAPPPLVAVGTGGSPMVKPPGSKPPVLLRSFIRGEKRPSGSSVKGAKTENNRGATRSSTSPWDVFAAYEAYLISAAGAPPIGLPDLSSLPDRNGLGSEPRAGQDRAKQPTVSGFGASSMTAKSMQKETARHVLESTSNGGVGERPMASQSPQRMAPRRDDIAKPKSGVCGAVASSSPRPTKSKTTTAATATNQRHAFTSSVAVPVGTQPPSSRRGTGKGGALTSTGGGGVADAACSAHLEASKQGASAQRRLHACDCTGVHKMENAQDSLFPAPVPSPVSSPPGGGGKQRRHGSKDGSESSDEVMERSSGDGLNVSRNTNPRDSMPSLGGSKRTNSILKKTSSYRSRNGSPVVRTLPVMGSVSFLLCEQEAALAMVSRQGVSKAVSRHAKPRHKDDL
ncbi:hypothetical protein JIQ42_02837 [Leishmania sp. Namibia]|uniref:hypothetical protein n=1 Tax=Leishmania sp. Namibia TaxID=2802991 RepID=UPI001B7C3C25|nr:hypothetical protein JIQ42_02837 [Leishmania sp. Namibia]